MVGHYKSLWIHPTQIDCFCFTQIWCFSQWIRLIETYYKGSFSKSFSLILFLVVMSIILEYSVQARIPRFTANNATLSLLPAFLDNLSSTVSQGQTLLSRCIATLTWARLEFRADKGGSIVIFRGRSINATSFYV